MPLCLLVAMPLCLLVAAALVLLGEWLEEDEW